RARPAPARTRDSTPPFRFATRSAGGRGASSRGTRARLWPCDRGNCDTLAGRSRPPKRAWATAARRQTVPADAVDGKQRSWTLGRDAPDLGEFQGELTVF